MYKAIKDKKIIALNDTGIFPCLNYETVEEDTKHSIEDYVMVGSEFVLSTDEKAIEKQNQERIAELEEYLSSTDWYAIRFADIGEEYPAEIREKRQEARDEISRLRGA